MRTGEQIGRYEIKEKLGSGGMGEVYRAVDDQLGRDVALKVLLQEFCSDSERVKRFKFEAKAVSALNHPGIITIHEIVESEGQLFISTEFVDGNTVRDRIEAEDVSLYEAVRIAEQVAEALAVAHDANIVHRDIKPENIMVRRDGLVKILDFGLAKPIVQSVAGAEDATIQLVKTQPGLVMGSVRYMSPEQARGRETDGTTDVWSLGIVLYEMITGINPFEGETISDSIAALIHKEPERIEGVPEEVHWVLSKALNKKPRERYQDIRDLAIDLRTLRVKLEQDHSGELSGGMVLTGSHPYHNTSENKTLIHRTVSSENRAGGSTGGVQPTLANTLSSRIGRGGVGIAAVAALLVAVAAGWYFAPSLFGERSEPFQSLEVSRLTDNGRAHSATVSPDGKFVVFVDAQEEIQKLIVRQIATGSSVEIVESTEDYFLQPSFSPDGNFIYYVSVNNGVGTLYRISTLGGQSRKLAVDIDSRPAVSLDGTRIAFIRHDPKEGGDTILMVDAEGGDPEPFVNTKGLGFNKFHDVIWTENDAVLLAAGNKAADQTSARTNIVAVDVSSRKAVDSPATGLFEEDAWSIAGSFQWLEDDRGVIFIGKKEVDDTRQIWHLRFPDRRLDTVTTDTSDYESLSVSADGRTIVATKADRISKLVAYTSPEQAPEQVKADSKNFLGYLGVVRTGTGEILYSNLNGKEADIFSMSEKDGKEVQLTEDSGFNVFPSLTPDGEFVLFSSSRNDSYGVWKMRRDGSGAQRLTTVKNGRDMMPQAVAGGEFVVFSRQFNDGSRAKLMSVPIDGGQVTELFPDSKGSDQIPRISPDGKKLAYLSSEFSEEEAQMSSHIKIAEISGKGTAKIVEKLEIHSAHMFEWTPDGDSIVYRKKGNGLIEISLKTGKERPLELKGTGEIMDLMWSADGSKMYAVRGTINSDLVLIKNRADA